jgi:hypothetical protein
MSVSTHNFGGIKLSVRSPRFSEGQLISTILTRSKEEVNLEIGLVRVIENNKGKCLIELAGDEKPELEATQKALQRIDDVLVNFAITKAKNIWKEDLSSNDIKNRYIRILKDNQISLNCSIPSINENDFGLARIYLSQLVYNSDSIIPCLELINLDKIEIKNDENESIGDDRSSVSNLDKNIINNDNSECSVESIEKSNNINNDNDTSSYECETNINLPTLKKDVSQLKSSNTKSTKSKNKIENQDEESKVIIKKNTKKNKKNREPSNAEETSQPKEFSPSNSNNALATELYNIYCNGYARS